jgi:hypothetical protein
MASDPAPQEPDTSHEDIRYQYQILSRPNSVRLLRLYPGEGTDPIYCALHTAELDLDPSYEAISYVWGDPSNKQDITCDSRRLDVTKNLHSILLQLRHPTEYRVLWADAICINQNDLSERIHQVGIMGSIYRKASSVIIWLGPGDSTVSREIQRIATQHDTISSLSHTQTDAVASLLKTPWFSRVWVIQEAALSQRAYIVWGDIEIEWSPLMLLLKRIGDQRVAVGDLWSKVGAEWNLWTAHRMYNPAKQNVLDLVTLLYVARGHSATDPRDHIFAFLGHSANLVEGQPLLRPDYTMSKADVFRETTKAFFSAMQNLDVLSYVTHDEQPHVAGELPSWVPVWDTLPSTLTGFEVRVFPFPETGVFHDHGMEHFLSETLIDTTGEEDVLLLRGLELDIVEWHSETILYSMIPPGLWDMGEQTEKHHPLERIWSDLKKHFLAKYSYSDEDLLQSFSHLLTSGVLGKRKAEHHIEEHAANFESWRQAHAEHVETKGDELFSSQRKPEAGKQGSWGQFVADAFRACNGRRMFCTKNGHLGLGPMAMRAGDTCAFLSGAKVPFILRPKGDCFMLIGEAYLNGTRRGKGDAVKGQSMDRVFKLI